MLLLARLFWLLGAGSDDRCYNDLNLVVVDFLNRKGPVSHVPINCIDVNDPLKYQCFLCDNSDLGSDFDQARSHLIECQKMNRPAYIQSLRRMFLNHNNPIRKNSGSILQKNILKAVLERKVEAKIDQLKATIGHLTNELNDAKATIDELGDKECKCSVTKILNADLEKKVEKLRAQLEKAITEPEEKKAEIVQLKATIGRLTNELKNAKPSINIEFKGKKSKCSVPKAVKKQPKSYLREKEIIKWSTYRIENY
jgi:chaperonin cofactor prefoldin